MPLLLCAIFLAHALPAQARPRDYSHLVIFSDPHLPGRLIPAKNKVVDTVNSWQDVAAVAVLGDITETSGTPQEYAFAKTFFSRLKKPLYPIAGNHDYIYEVGPEGKMDKAPPADRRAKLKLFADTFSLPALHYEKRLGRYLCLFISNDDLDSRLLTVMSSSTLAWLEDELRRNARTPTLVFFHAPLAGTIQSRNEIVDNDSFVAQPADQLRRLLLKNPQVFLWASGHVHLAATNAKFADAKANLYDGRIAEIHNSDMDGRSYLSDQDRGTTTHDTIWTNSLFLYPDRVVVKTFDHKKGVWLKALTRTVRPPR